MARYDYRDALEAITRAAEGHQRFSSIVKVHPTQLSDRELDAIYEEVDRRGRFEFDWTDTIRRDLKKAGLI